MKKLLAKIQLIMVMTAIVSSFAFANTAVAQETNPVTVDTYLPDPVVTDEYKPELEAVQNLPKLTLEEAITKAIKTILAMAMSITLIGIVVAAIFYVISEGDEESVTKAKRIIVYLVVGMAIMAAAYGVVSGFANIDFFQNTPDNTETTTIEENE